MIDLEELAERVSPSVYVAAHIVAIGNGYFQGFNAGHGVPLPSAGPSLIGVPIVGGAAMAGLSKLVYDDIDDEAVAKTATTCLVAEGIGYALGYIVGKY